MKELQRDTYQEVAGICTGVASINTELAGINTNMASLVGVLQDINTTLCRAFPPAFTPSCGKDKSMPSTSATATGREALSEEDTPTCTPVSAAADPLSGKKRECPPKNPGGGDGKTPTNARKKPCP